MERETIERRGIGHGIEWTLHFARLQRPRRCGFDRDSEIGGKIIRLLVMSMPLLAVTTNRELESKIICSPAMSTPSWLRP